MKLIHTILELTVVTILIGSGIFLSADGARPAPASQANEFRVTIRVNAARTKGELRPIWRFFGADEPNFAYMKDGKKLLAELGQLGAQTAYFRTHNLLTSGDGTPALKWGSTGAYREDAQGQPVYNWTILDRIFDTYLERGLKPYVQIGFMPKDLSIKPEPYQHRWTPTAKYDEIYTGWAYPPKDYAKWAELVFQWAKHCVEKYGRTQIERWYWEVDEELLDDIRKQSEHVLFSYNVYQEIQRPLCVTLTQRGCGISSSRNSGALG